MKIRSKGTFLFYFSLNIILFLFSCNNQHDTKKNNVHLEKTELSTSTLLLLSKGLTNDTLKSEFLKLLKKESHLYSIAVIVNASSTEKKKIKKTKKVKIQFAEMGLDSSKIELFDLVKTEPQKLKEYDIIYILGGNPFLLLDDINRSGAQKAITEFFESDKIIMGYSAGALLLGPDLSLLNHVDSLLEFNQLKLTELSCLGLYDFYIFPHFRDFTTQIPELSEKIQEFELKKKLAVKRLNDNQGIIISRGVSRIIGK